MSIPSGYVHCHGCDFKGIMQRRPVSLEYSLPNGVLVEGYRIFAWCSSCTNVTEAEEAFDAASIQCEIDSLKRQQVGFFGRLFGGGKAEDIELKRLEGRLLLAQLRQSKPRCLKCGREAVVPLAFDNSGTSAVIHTCGRRLFLVPNDPDAPRLIFRPEVIQLDQEGRKI